MITRKFLSDESGLTVALETILLFSISVIFFGMIYFSFQDMNQRQNKILVEEELLTIGNTIAKQLSDLTVEARASNKLGSSTTIESEFRIPAKIGDSSYRVKLTAGKIMLESISPPYITVEVPVNTDINLAENSTIYSNDERFTIEYNSESSAIYFTNGGVIPFPDFNAPTISIIAPPDNATIGNSTYINVTVWDDVGVTRVEYYVDGSYRYTAGSPYNWLWDTSGETDGNYTVTAVAYDAAGHTKPDVRNYTIYNPYFIAPVITIISPSDGENTTFKKPIIKADITDDKALDYSSIRLWIDNINQTGNATFVDVPPKKTTLTYTPSQNMAVGEHSVKIRASDLNATPLENWANRSFNVTDISDMALPLASILFPTSNTILYPGTPITVTYLASDLLDSGLDNMTIYVSNSTGTVYSHYEDVSIYPYVVYEINPQETWTFNYSYAAGMNYTYNITVFDRYGRSAIPTLGPLSVASGLVGQFEVDTSANYTTGPSGGNYFLKNIRVRDNVSDSLYPVIDKVTVSWSSSGGSEKIKNISFGGTNYWTGNKGSGTQNDITDYTTQNAFQSMDMGFNFDIRSRTFTIDFLLKDTTSRTVIFYVPP